MKKSIRFRFSVIFIGLMAMILLGIWGVNNWLLEDFYINQKIEALQLAYSEVNELVKEKMEHDEYLGVNFDK